MNRKIIVLPLTLGACLAISVFTLNFARSTKPVSPQTKQVVPYTQPITSCANGIKVVKAQVTNVGTPDAAIEVQIENLSNVGITAVSLEATNGKWSYTTTLRSSFKQDNTMVVIKPHQTASLSMQLFENVPLRIGGVFYEDGTEEGCASALKTLHEVKETEKPK